MYKFSSVIDDMSFEKIKNGQKTVKFFYVMKNVTDYL